MQRLRAVIPIIAMPFDEHDRVDVDSLQQQVDFLAGIGAEIVGFGFASESFRLTEAEYDDAIRAVCERAVGRVRVLVQIAASSTAAAVARSHRVADLGADLLMVPAALAVRARESDEFDYFRAVAAATGLPVVIQDAPALTGMPLSVTLLARLFAELPRVVGLKIEELPTAPKIAAVAGRLDHRSGVLGGAGGADFYHELERGASGTMPGAGLPELFLDVLRLHREGRRAQARRLFNRYLPVLALALRSSDTFCWVQKEILRRRGVIASARMRRPHECLDPGLRADLDVLLAELLPYSALPPYSPEGADHL